MAGKKIKDMSKKEVENEYRGIMQSIEHASFSTGDLRYRDALEDEIARRGYEIIADYSLA